MGELELSVMVVALRAVVGTPAALRACTVMDGLVQRPAITEGGEVLIASWVMPPMIEARCVAGVRPVAVAVTALLFGALDN